MLIICIACHSPLHGIDQWVCAPCKAAAPKRTPEETRALLRTWARNAFGIDIDLEEGEAK